MTTKAITAISFLLVILYSSCKKGNQLNPENDTLSVHWKGSHFDYYFSRADKNMIDTIWQESYYKWLMTSLNLNPDQKLQFLKYRDRDHLKRMTGKDTNGFAEVGTNKFHTIWRVDSHESVHTIVMLLVGHPPPLFNEGIAVAHQANYPGTDFIPGWNGQDFNLLSRNFRQSNKLPSLDDLLGTYTFGNLDPNISYPVAGSFVRFLINKYGIEKIKEYVKLSQFDDSKNTIHLNFTSIYSISIESEWNNWNEFIAKY